MNMIRASSRGSYTPAGFYRPSTALPPYTVQIPICTFEGREKPACSLLEGGPRSIRNLIYLSPNPVGEPSAPGGRQNYQEVGLGLLSLNTSRCRICDRKPQVASWNFCLCGSVPALLVLAPSRAPALAIWHNTASRTKNSSIVGTAYTCESGTGPNLQWQTKKVLWALAWVTKTLMTKKGLVTVVMRYRYMQGWVGSESAPRWSRKASW